uniref:Uncharacterized protein n=1 Tax=Rhizophora mucronata TaxID=61149 RepID=A0A2P2QX80_RHIMU
MGISFSFSIPCKTSLSASSSIDLEICWLTSAVPVMESRYDASTAPPILPNLPTAQ